MNSQPGPVRREDVLLALSYAGLTWLLHSVNMTASSQPAVAVLAPFWPLFTMGGCAAVVLRRNRTGAMVVACSFAGAALLLAGSAGGFFLLFEAVFSLVLFGSARAARMTEVSVLALSGAAGAGGWLAGGSLATGVAAVLAAAMVLLLPAQWAGNLRKARELAFSEHDLAVASERQDMARELHDVLSSRLSAIALQSAAALGSQDHLLAREVLGHVRGESVAGLKDLNTMIRALNSGEPSPRAGEIADLDTVVAAHRAAGMDIEWRNTLPGSGASLDGPTQAALYRMAVESIVNAGKHAPGARVSIRLDRVPSGVHLAVCDDGGATPSPPWRGRGTGTGIPSMQARAEQLAGQAAAGPRGNGWAVEITLPLPESPGGGGTQA